MTGIVFRCFACKHGKHAWCRSRFCECDHKKCQVCGRREVEHSPRNAFMPGPHATGPDAPASTLDTPQVEKPLAPNDARYVRDSAALVADWSRASLTDHEMTRAYWRSIQQQAALVVRILEGEPSPWADSVPEDYLAVMASMRRSEP